MSSAARRLRPWVDAGTGPAHTTETTMTTTITTFLSYDTQAAMQAMMGMQKLDLGKLQAAFAGV
jgi:hypothetical protein